MAEIDAVLSLVKENRSKYTPCSQMGKAFRYIEDYSLYLTTYMECVEGTPSNNNVERLAKAFATGRKNWLFSNCEEGLMLPVFSSPLLKVQNCKVSVRQTILNTYSHLACMQDGDRMGEDAPMEC